MKKTHSPVLNNANGVSERKGVGQIEEADQRKDANQKRKAKEKVKPMMAMKRVNKSKMTKGDNTQFLFFYILKSFNLKHLYYFEM